MIIYISEMFVTLLNAKCPTEVDAANINWHVFIPSVTSVGEIFKIQILDFFNPRNDPKKRWAPLLISQQSFEVLKGKL